MSWLTDLLGESMRASAGAAFELAVQNWWLGILVIAYQGALIGLVQLVAPLGIVGGSS